MQAQKAVAQPDELVDFHHLRARRGLSQLEIEDQVIRITLEGCLLEFMKLHTQSTSDLTYAVTATLVTLSEAKCARVSVRLVLHLLSAEILLNAWAAWVWPHLRRHCCLQVATDLQRATGTADADSADANRLNRVLQLTGRHDCRSSGAFSCSPCCTHTPAAAAVMLQQLVVGVVVRLQMPPSTLMEARLQYVVALLCMQPHCMRRCLCRPARVWHSAGHARTSQ